MSINNSSHNHSQLSANEHSQSEQFYLRTLFSSQSNSLYKQSRRRTLSRKPARTLFMVKMLRSLVSGHPVHIIYLTFDDKICLEFENQQKGDL